MLMARICSTPSASGTPPPVSPVHRVVGGAVVADCDDDGSLLRAPVHRPASAGDAGVGVVFTAVAGWLLEPGLSLAL